MSDPVRLIYDGIVTEEGPSVHKQKEYIFPTETCHNFIETLQGIIRKIDYWDTSSVPNIFDEVQCKTEIRRVEVLGEYFSRKQKIRYYKQPSQHLEITKIHERFHAAHHLREDVNGKIWNNYESVTPFRKELLAQLFTFIYLRDTNSKLLPDFIELNWGQPLIYHTYKIFKHYNQKEAEELYWIIRNNENKTILNILENIELHISQAYMSGKSLESKISNQLVKSLSFICKNPLVFVSETDIHTLVCHDLMSIDELNPYKSLCNTDCTIGLNKIGKVSTNKYKTTLIHKEYGHATSDYSRSDIVILNKNDVGKIIDPINLKYKNGKDGWLIPDFIFEFGTEKSAGSAKDFRKHLHNDLEKTSKAKVKGYLIHIHRNYIRSSGDRKQKNLNKFDLYLNELENEIINFQSKHPGKSPKIIIIRIDIGSDGRVIKNEGKVKIVEDPMNHKYNFKAMNIKDIENTLKSYL